MCEKTRKRRFITKESERGMASDQTVPENQTPEEADESIDATPMYRKKRIILPVFIALAIACAAGWYWYVNLRDFESTDDAYIDADRVTVSSKILGRITQLMVDEGDSVAAGQVLVRIDDSDLKAQEAQAAAALAAAQENVKLANVNLDNATIDFHRAEKQLAGNVITQEQFEHARKARDAAEAQRAVAVAQVGTANAQLGVIRTNLANTMIMVPVRGVVSKRWALAGDVVQPAQPIFSIYAMSHLWITANIEETRLAQIRLGAPVDIDIDTYPDRAVRGKVFQIGSNTAGEFSLIPPNNASGNFTKVTQRVPVKISLDEETARQLRLLPGMSVEVKIRVR